jgi:4-amino-4-deoxy-L-arabinose transferase-like glycosyltransferase
MPLYQKILLVVTLAVGLWLRLYRLDGPIADWQSFRQADTASVTRIFSQQGIDLLHPRYHDLSDIQSGVDNPRGWRMVELPLYNAISVVYHRIFGTNIEVSSRMVSIIFSLGSALLIFLICFKLTSSFWPSYLPIFIFLFLPFNIYYSRAILPEPTAVFFMLLAVYLFKPAIILSGISLALAILVKPYTALIIFPSLLLFCFQKYKKNINLWSLLVLFLFSAIILLPFLWWRHWISQYPAGIPKSDWLLNNSDSTTFPNWFHGYNLTFLNKLVALRPHWWQWLFYDRIGNLILGAYGLIPLFLGLAYKKNKTQIFSFSLILGIFLYFIIVAQGNIQHDYYQVLIIPSLAVLCGFGCYYIVKFLFRSKILAVFILTVIFIFSSYFSWTRINGYYQINRPQIISAGQKAATILPANSLVIAPYNGDTAFLYQTGFSGWPTEIYDIPDKVKTYPANPIYLVSVNYDRYTNSLIPKYPVIFKNNDFIILKLSP